MLQITHVLINFTVEPHTSGYLPLLGYVFGNVVCPFPGRTIDTSCIFFMQSCLNVLHLKYILQFFFMLHTLYIRYICELVKLTAINQ